MVIKAVQTYENCHSDPFGRGSITISLNLSNPGPDPKCPGLDGTLQPPFMSLGHKLVPGGKYLFVHWSHGYIELIDIENQSAVWTYAATRTAETSHCINSWVNNYDVEFRKDGSIAVVVCVQQEECGLRIQTYGFAIPSSTQSNLSCVRRLVEVFMLDLEPLKSRRLFTRTIEDTKYTNILATVIAIGGDFVALLCKKYIFALPSMLLINYVSDEIVFSETSEVSSHSEYSTNRAEVHISKPGKRLDFGISIFQEHLFYGVTSGGPANSLASFIKVLNLRQLFTSGEMESMDVELEVPIGIKIDRLSPPSLCAFHWKEEHERHDQIMVQFSVGNRNGQIYKPVTNYYIFSPENVKKGLPVLDLISSTGLVLSNLGNWYTRLDISRYRPTLSGYSLYKTCLQNPNITFREATGLFISTLDDGSDHGHCETSFPLPNLIGFLFGCSEIYLDYLSNAIILQDPSSDTKLEIVYPA